MTGRFIKNQWLAMLVLLSFITASSFVAAIAPEDVKEYGDVFIISAIATDRQQVELTWDIAPDYYLYNNRFLAFSSGTPGVELGQARLPKGKISFDELLGEEVEKYTGKITVHIPLVQVAADLNGFQLRVRSQGCLEDVLCYPPTEQVVLVGLPPLTSNDLQQLPGADDATTLVDEAPVATSSALSELNAAVQSTPLPSSEQSSGTEWVEQPEPALEAEQAFAYEAIGLNAETALVRFTAQPGYYLYRDQFAFRVLEGDGFVVRAVELPEGVIKDDPEFGPVPVFYGQIEVPVRFNRPAGPSQNITLQADFQGCRDGEICYPPQSRTLGFEMPNAPQAIVGQLSQSQVQQSQVQQSQASSYRADNQQRFQLCPLKLTANAPPCP